ncbi:hypothetical protein M0R45_034947 [Rubus argutus]|uniref:Uncharacterized protein n=1 Tax=Rubus argutus TaxID=59490 RepID=A0AAW1VX23_RUBAR
MGFSSLCLTFVSMYILSIFVLFHLVVANSLQSYTTACHDDEISALLQFKQSFVISTSASGYNGAYPKTASWNSAWNQTSNCCSWDGVECDENTGHVIGLNLSSSYLYGSINPNNSLFRLVHLQSLNLADNDFNYSQVPTSIRNFPKLRYLNLSYSVFSGLVPFEISQLSKLSSLDLSKNYDLTGYFPKFNASSSPLMSLKLSSTSFLINLSSLIEEFDSLKELDVRECNISESSLPFLFGRLRHLIYLDISSNNFNGPIPYFLGNFIQLRYLSLSGNNFNGQIPSFFENLIQLTYLDISSNNFHGQIPSFFENLIQLTNLDISSNNFHGSIPQSLFNLMNLRFLDLSKNNLSGTIEFYMFHKLQNLTSLFLSGNKLEVLTESRFMNNTIALPKFEYLGLGWCNIRDFPNFLRSQQTLWSLDLSGNQLQDQVPNWMLNTSTQTLQRLNISHNFLSGFEQSPVVLPWANLTMLDLSYNMLRELSPLSSTSIQYYAISNNNLTGKVSPLICNMTSLFYLDFSNNKLSGILPQCLGNFSADLQYFNLGNNSFRGTLPQTYTNTSNLRMIDFSRNHFHGQLPRSLAYCANLEIVLLSHNNFTDTFPNWLGALPELNILTMDHNGFYGVIVKPNKKNLHFPVLRILDLSYNNFAGEFPFEYIFSGNGTTSFNQDLGYYYTEPFGYCSFTITSKGVERFYPKIQQDLVLIDISINNFEGQIPDFIGKLKGLWSLNISGNTLTGEIPSSLGNLTRLESLDLSKNKLSGEIPQILAQLDFLTKFNVSYNNLTGPVPRGIHFTTFDYTSYEGNPGLCGDPLSKKCENPEGTQLPTSTAEENDGGNGIELDWKFVWAGLGSGLLVGVVLADFVITKWNLLFIEIVTVLIRLSKRMRRPRY